MIASPNSGAALLLVDSYTGRAYLQKLAARGLLPTEILLVDMPMEAQLSRLGVFALALPDWASRPILPRRTHKLWRTRHLVDFDPGFAAFEPVTQTLQRLACSYRTVRSDDINGPEVIDAVARMESRYVVFSGGGILRAPILSQGKQFLHCHPGVLPSVRGSECMLWSLLKDGRCGVSCFFMDVGIDSGAVLRTRTFDVPPVLASPERILSSERFARRLYDLLLAHFDAYMRAEILCDVVADLVAGKQLDEIPQRKEDGTMYYMLHPVMRDLALVRAARQSRPPGTAG